ncbi:Ku protein [Halothermothrix orenii]|uniref:Non-homologous end joining protein Ku n=1 Tax=Halothermothrix orenii (strain H 168 / OCM 544 / DSM 9562) TaxID=373903 RepID=B8D1M4_HALOH|nr:Ku protein [Halothermothrix orenii]ACL69101.1 Ku family containing protein [Halothermothrix orenii H 168]
MRTIWKGAISFGLVNIPIKLVTATTKKNIRFRFLHKECKTPVSTKRFCPTCKKEVEYGDLVKGYEYEDNKFVVLKDEDFDNIPVKSTKTIDIVDFVKLEDIDPVYYIKTYYLNPAEGGEKPYLLLKKAMDDTGKVAISKITIRKKESLAVIRVMDDVLALETMFFADEVRPASELGLNNIEEKIKIGKKEEELAVEIVNNLTTEFKPEKYTNEYREELMNIIRQKIEGKEVETPDVVPEERKIVDLMEKLKKSVEATEEGEGKKKKKTKKKTG